MTKTTKDDTTIDPTAKRAAIKLMTKGLVTRSEASRLARVSRQLARHWVADVDVDAIREARLTYLWNKTLKHKSII
jgi:hypothetical protein